jgi:hypothetical protein
MFHFAWEMFLRAFFASVAAMGTTVLAVCGGIAAFLFVLFRRLRFGLKEMTRHWKDTAKDGVMAVVAWWGMVFCYQLFIKIPASIRYEADQVKPPNVLAPKPPSLASMKSAPMSPMPSFVFAIPAVIVNGDTWDFIIKHEGEREVESIDLMFVDVEKLHFIQKTTPPQTDVPPTEYSVLLHVDKMYPKGRGSLFAKQFIWKPFSLDHEHYTVDVSASTGRFHEDLFVEQVEGKWTNAAKVEDAETKKTLFICRDSGFPDSMAPMVVARRNCWPDWIK